MRGGQMMEQITYAIQILITFPIRIYVWYKTGQLSRYLNLDLQFVLKKWWALWYIPTGKKSILKHNDVKYKIKRILKPYRENPLIIMDENSCNSISFYGADQKGNSLFVKMDHRGYHVVELILQLTLPDGRIYVLPDCPDTIRMVGTSQKWSASGLKIETLEPRQRWRIIYNGLLRIQNREDTPDNNNIEHIRLNFIFTGKTQELEWPDDWSPYLHANALAREPWKSPNWMHKIKSLDYTGFDRWGSAIGQITFKDSSVSALYLRGICQRRWGKHESYQFYRTITFFGVTKHGTMYYFGVNNTKHSFPHMEFGHIEAAMGRAVPIDWIDLNVRDFEKENIVPRNYKIAFTADGKDYNVVMEYTGNATTYYNGQPWSWACKTHNLRVKLNSSTGVGMMVMSCPYTGSNQTKVSPVAKIQCLTRSDTFAQKDKYILDFADKQCQNESIVGGKGYSLAVLTSVITDDFTVPQGFCVTTLALERQLQHHEQLQDLIADIVDISCGKKSGNLKSFCEKAVPIIESTPVEKQIEEAILEALKQLELDKQDTRNWRYAVRSSAVGEDTEETSAAGQNSTYLGLRNANDIITHIAKCWASLFSYQSVEYRRQNGLPIKASMGVCVQRMIDAEAAGVMFTRHPTTGDPSRIIITSNYGLGESVVSGKVEPDTLTIYKKWDNTVTGVTTVLGDKHFKISMDDDNGVIWDPVTEQEMKKSSITSAIALKLVKIGVDLESIFGSARDVEWAVVGKRIFLLQARPITTINAWTDFELIHELDSAVPCDVDLMSFANVEEVIPYPLSPLSISSVLKVLNLSIGSKFRALDNNYLHMVGMRCAINYFDSALRAIDNNVTIYNKMIDLAVCGRVITTPEVHRAAVDKYGTMSIWQKLSAAYDMHKIVKSNKATVQTAVDIAKNYTLDINEFDKPHSLYNMLNTKYEEIFSIGRCHNLSSLVSVYRQMIAMMNLTKGTEGFTSDHLADIAVLLSSCTNVISTEVPIALGKIAACIKRSGKAKEFSKVELVNVMDWLKSNCPSAAEKLENFFEVHGHRCVQELDLLSEPWILKPDSIINTIQSLATSMEENYVSKTLNIEETMASLRTPMSSSTKSNLQKMIPLCREAVTLREKTKSLIISLVHKLRLAYKRLGAMMAAEGYIPDENLIFFLTHQEIGTLLNDHNSLLVRKALRRKKLHRQVAECEYPEFSTGMPVPIQKTLDASSYEGCTKIEGTSVCGGYHMGRACVITNLSEAKDIQYGDILITHCTDIGWSPYFPLLGGIVTELGGLISHGAVVAREYGLPCIVGAKGATKIFRTGDEVLLTGDAGVLQLITPRTSESVNKETINNTDK